MNKLIQVASGFLSKLKRLFAPGGGAEKALDAVAEHLPKALAIVKLVDSLAPNKTTNEIVHVVEQYGLPSAAKYVTAAQYDKGAAMFQLASDLLEATLPAGQKTSIINAAIQLAYTSYKAEGK